MLNLFYGSKGCDQVFEGNFFLNVLVGGGWGDVVGWWLRGLEIGGGLGDEMDALRDRGLLVLYWNPASIRKLHHIIIFPNYYIYFLEIILENSRYFDKRNNRYSKIFWRNNAIGKKNLYNTRHLPVIFLLRLLYYLLRCSNYIILLWNEFIIRLKLLFYAVHLCNIPQIFSLFRYIVSLHKLDEDQ